MILTQETVFQKLSGLPVGGQSKVCELSRQRAVRQTTQPQAMQSRPAHTREGGPWHAPPHPPPSRARRKVLSWGLVKAGTQPLLEGWEGAQTGREKLYVQIFLVLSRITTQRTDRGVGSCS